jgi:hypothetical protein
MLLALASSRILLNGRPGQAIQHRRGVRQGDSLSLMLFIIVMEAFARLVDSTAESRLLRPTGAAPIRHHCSIYADDVILFMHLSAGEANAIKTILQIFGDASGLRTNLGKCSIMPIQRPGGQHTVAAGHPGMPDRGLPHNIPRPPSEREESAQGQDPIRSGRSRQTYAGLPRTPHEQKRKAHLDQVGVVRNPDLHHHCRRSASVGNRGDQCHL